MNEVSTYLTSDSIKTMVRHGDSYVVVAATLLDTFGTPTVTKLRPAYFVVVAAA